MTPVPDETRTLRTMPDGSRYVQLIWHEHPGFPCAKCADGWYLFRLVAA